MSTVMFLTQPGDHGEQIILDMDTKKVVYRTKEGWNDVTAEEPVGLWYHPDNSVLFGQSDEYDIFVSDKHGYISQPFTRVQSTVAPGQPWLVAGDSTGYYFLELAATLAKINPNGTFGWQVDMSGAITAPNIIYLQVFPTYVAVLNKEGTDLVSYRFQKTDGAFIAASAPQSMGIVDVDVHATERLGPNNTDPVILTDIAGGGVTMLLADQSGGGLTLTAYTGAHTLGQQFHPKTYSTAVKVGIDYYFVNSATGVNASVPTVFKLNTGDFTISNIPVTGTAITDIDVPGSEVSFEYCGGAAGKLYVSATATVATNTSQPTTKIYEIDAATGASTLFWDTGRTALIDPYEGYVLQNVPLYEVTGNVTVGGTPAQTELVANRTSDNKYVTRTVSDVNGDYSIRVLSNAELAITCKNPSGDWATHKVTPTLVV